MRCVHCCIYKAGGYCFCVDIFLVWCLLVPHVASVLFVYFPLILLSSQGCSCDCCVSQQPLSVDTNMVALYGSSSYLCNQCTQCSICNEWLCVKYNHSYCVLEYNIKHHKQASDLYTRFCCMSYKHSLVSRQLGQDYNKLIVLFWKMVFSTSQSQLLFSYFLVQKYLQFTLGVCIMCNTHYTKKLILSLSVKQTSNNMS